MPHRQFAEESEELLLTWRNDGAPHSGDRGGMWTYHPDLLATPVPRYTSFPTAAEFVDGIGLADADNALAAASGDVSLYLHIPFCETICWYCGCNTGRANRRQRLSTYLEALHSEIALVGRALPATARVRRIAIGGGSPNAISPTDFVRLFLSLTQAFALDDPVISIELDPRTLDQAWAKALAGVGVSRASLGVQTFDPATQEAIGRVQPSALIAQCTDMLRGAGVTSLNFDLMYGLPGQDDEVLLRTLTEAHALGVDRIALFGYAHVPHLIPRQRRIDGTRLPDQAQRFAMASLGHEWLTGQGYLPVGFDHFAKPEDPLAEAAASGRLHRNFQGFTDDDAGVLIGLGASAISSFPDLLVQNEKNAGRYRMMLSQERLPASRGVRRSRDDQERGRIIEQLLCAGHASVGRNLLEEVRLRLQTFIDRGLAEIRGDDLVIPPRALPYARSIAALFDPYRADAAKRFSNAV